MIHWTVSMTGLWHYTGREPDSTTLWFKTLILSSLLVKHRRWHRNMSWHISRQYRGSAVNKVCQTSRNGHNQTKSLHESSSLEIILTPPSKKLYEVATRQPIQTVSAALLVKECETRWLRCKTQCRLIFPSNPSLLNKLWQRIFNTIVNSADLLELWNMIN